jgi:hypothetical protein
MRLCDLFGRHTRHVVAIHEEWHPASPAAVKIVALAEIQPMARYLIATGLDTFDLSVETGGLAPNAEDLRRSTDQDR